VLRTAAYPAESAIAFAPIIALLRAGLGRSDAVERLRVIEAWQLAEIDRLVPLPASLLTARDSTPRPDSPAAQARLLESVATALVALAAGSRPGLAVLDDVQWADEASRGALLYVARRLAGRPLILVVSWRPEDLDDLGLAFTERLREIATATVHLDRLDRADVAELVRAAGLSGSAALAQADALSERSEGLPLYVVEALATRPDQGAEAAQLPRGMRALLRERIASVGEAAGQVLAAASVVGRSFDLAVLRATAGRSEEETISALEELTRHGLVRERAGRSITYDFAHGTLRDATYESMSLARRRLLHHRVAVAIREQGGWRDDPERLALIAGHERDAGRDAEAAEAFLEAGLRQRAVYAHHEAALAFSAALALGHPDADGIQRALGEIHMAHGDYRAALTALEAGAAIAPPDDLPAIELRLAQVHARRGDLVAARSHLDASIAGLGEPARDSLARQALIERARIALRAGDVEAATASASEALGAAEVAGATTDLGLALRMRGLAERAKGDLSAARDDLTRSVAIAEESEDAAASIGARNALALVEAADGDRQAAIAHLEAALEDARRTGERHLEAAIENNLADQLHAAGAEDAAMDHLKQAVALFADIGGEPDELEPEIWKLVAW
jgi:tetratricopeptide (TPR) repeat protein